MRAWGITDIGLQRSENQDSYAIDQREDGSCIVAVVCDGMGGVNGGKLASSIAVETFIAKNRALL
ncbi:MAG: protein phosphatase 2C domain-containing protein, partial [Oscillospiraceae bacterium]|nr:protein phosphatase 2C domain-containing protein [Oscillospiraceae bacterium]